ncbi:MAG: hypothetical protein KH230_09460 [Enterocloster asparagiformis]|nr:hypothetical protein [Enterocloster asparagiformis]
MKLKYWNCRNAALRRARKRSATLPLLEGKAQYFKTATERQKIRWYRQNCKWLWFKLSLRKRIRFLASLRIPFKGLSVIRWVVVDFLRAKPKKFWGIYQFVALPGEGKTLSMVAHMERCRKELGADRLYIATNFYYARQDVQIVHWLDMVKAAKYANDHGMYCIIAFDEIHVTFDSSDWKSFPPEMLALLSFNRKYGMQFLCSSQIYDRIPRKVRDIANYTVICKNTLGLDRHFVNYYFTKANYDATFSGKRKRAEFIRTYVAGDELYGLYDTLAQVDRMVEDASVEKRKREDAIELLFGKSGDDPGTD